MERTYVTTGDSTHEALAELAETEHVTAVFALVAESATAHRAELAAAGTETDLTLFGGIFPQLIVDGVAHEEGTLLLGLSQPPEVTHITGLSDTEQGYTDQLPDLLSRGFETAFVLVDAFASRTDVLIRALFNTYGVELNVLGGGAGSLSMEQQPCLLTDEGWHEDGALIAATEANGNVGVRHGWQEFAGPFRVTGAEGNVVTLLGDEPAYDVYREVVEPDAGVEIGADNFFEVAKSYPLGLSRFDAEKIVRDPFEPTADGGLRCFGDVPQGSFVHVLKGDPASLIEAAGEAADAARAIELPGGGPRSTLFFDCISRVLYLESEFERELATVADRSDAPLVGALTIGEIANSGREFLELYNKTAVVGVVDSV